jgi:hypothetical protein
VHDAERTHYISSELDCRCAVCYRRAEYPPEYRQAAGVEQAIVIEVPILAKKPLSSDKVYAAIRFMQR